MTSPTGHIGPLLHGGPGNDDQVVADLVAHGKTAAYMQAMIDALGSMQVSFSMANGISSPSDLEDKFVRLVDVYIALAEGVRHYARIRDLLAEREAGS